MFTAGSFTNVILMKTRNLTRLCLLCSVLLLVPSFGLGQTIPSTNNTTVVVFSRHTFRGTTTKIGPTKISLPQYGIDLAIPIVSYGQNATPQGLSIAEHSAAPGLQAAAALALATNGEN